MAATVSIKECNGAGGTPTTVTAIRFCTTDAYNPLLTYPMVRPTSGTYYSYWKSLYLNADTTPAGTINNVKFYTDGSIGWTGVTLYAGVATNYVESSGTQGTTGDEAHATHTDVPTMTDASTYTSVATLALTGSIVNANTGKISQYLILQTHLSSSAVAGTLASETLSIQYDET